MRTPTAFLILAITFPPVIRVAVLKETARLQIEGQKMILQFHGAGQKRLRPEGTVIEVLPADTGLTVEGENFRYPLLTIESAETMKVQDKRFSGKIEIWRDTQKTLGVINEVVLEDYLQGLVHAEISPDWPEEAIKAQVVAARTYALFRKEKNRNSGQIPSFDLESTTSDQVYEGIPREDEGVKQAVKATEGEVLWYYGYFPAYFHSCCGGETTTVEKVWNQKEISTSVIDPYCKRSPHQSWEYRTTRAELLRSLANHGLSGKKLLSISAETYEDSPRVALVILETEESTLFLGGNDLRKILGARNLRSTWFQLQLTPREVVFKGTGYGHGVGLCQWGSKAMADQGADYRAILQFYYPKAAVRKMY